MNNAILLNLVTQKPEIASVSSFITDNEITTEFNKILDEKNELLVAPNDKSNNKEIISNKISKQNETDSEPVNPIAEVLSLILGIVNSNSNQANENTEALGQINTSLSSEGLAQFSLTLSELISSLENAAGTDRVQNILTKINNMFNELHLSEPQLDFVLTKLNLKELNELVGSFIESSIVDAEALKMRVENELTHFDQLIKQDSNSRLEWRLDLKAISVDNENIKSSNPLELFTKGSLPESEIQSLEGLSKSLNSLIQFVNIQKEASHHLQSIVKSSNNSFEANGSLDDSNGIESLLLNNDMVNLNDSDAFIKHINEQIELAKFSSALSANSQKSLGIELNHFNTLTNTVTENNSQLSANVADNVNRTYQGQLTTQFGTDAWQAALKQQILFFIKNGIQNAELRLHPQELGVIHIQMSLDDNLVKLQLFSGNAQVRHTMESALGSLKESFSEQGYDLSDSFVGFSESENQADENELAKTTFTDLKRKEEIIQNTEEVLQENHNAPHRMKSRSAGVDNFI
ncbi:flagellar hook-length control protein FliK [Thorsellia kenyensis]|uniref:Flagellar hook-length control protein FliK n=1 Tax=Thorsellia kenyensis TaxID=1549888 RepID=A0ABV6CCJ9_9GAMM